MQINKPSQFPSPPSTRGKTPYKPSLAEFLKEQRPKLKPIKPHTYMPPKLEP
jgi:hypothetical protein